MSQLACTVLLIDAAPARRQAYKDLLREHAGPLSFIEADSATGALPLCRTVEVDCILLAFGEADAPLHVQELRTEADCPVIVVTSQSDDDAIAQYFAHGATDCIAASVLNAQSLHRATRNAMQVAGLRRRLRQEQQSRLRLQEDLRVNETRLRALIDNVTAERRQFLVRLNELTGARDDFLRAASHALQTPVTSVLSQVQGLIRACRHDAGRPVSPRLLRGLEQVSSQLTNLSTVVRNLCDVADVRGEPWEARGASEPETVELSAMLERVLAACAQELSQAGNAVTLEVEDAVRGVWDRARLEQAVTNVVGNASKHAPGAHVEVRVGSRGRRAFIAVADRGQGIAPQDHRRIFERFERGEGEVAPSGLGLGLYVSRQILEALGGSIEVESRPGEGATFIMELPLEEPGNQARGPARM